MDFAPQDTAVVVHSLNENYDAWWLISTWQKHATQKSITAPATALCGFTHWPLTATCYFAGTTPEHNIHIIYIYYSLYVYKVFTPDTVLFVHEISAQRFITSLFSYSLLLCSVLNSWSRASLTNATTSNFVFSFR